jgi:cytochrome bd-type quinol oxidase subunit 1
MAKRPLAHVAFEALVIVVLGLFIAALMAWGAVRLVSDRSDALRAVEANLLAISTLADN